MDEYLYEIKDTEDKENFPYLSDEVIYQNATKRLHRNRISNQNNLGLITPESEDIYYGE